MMALTPKRLFLSLSASLSLFSALTLFSHAHLWSLKLSLTKLTLYEMTMAESTIKGFHSPLRLDRTAHGGGVAVWVRDDLAFQHLTAIDCGRHELIWLSINISSREKLVIGAVYRPGSASGHDISLLEHLDANLDHARRHGSHVLIVGDFNVHSESWLGSSRTTPAGEYTDELCAVHGLQQHVQWATRGRNRLDLVLSDLGERVSIKPTNPIGSSDHVTLLASINTKPFREKRTERLVWQNQKADWGRLRKFLKDVSWHSIMIIRDDPEQACDAMTLKILYGMQQSIPSKNLVTRPSDPSLWTPECTAAVRAKQFSWKRFRRNPFSKTRIDTGSLPQTVLHAFARQKSVNQLVYAGSSTVGLYPAKNGGQPSKKLAVKVATQVFPSSVMTTARNTQMPKTLLDALDVSSQRSAALKTGTLIRLISPSSLHGVRQPSTRYAFDHQRSNVCSASWIPRRQWDQTKSPHGSSRSVQRCSLLPSPTYFHSASVVESSPLDGRLLT